MKIFSIFLFLSLITAEIFPQGFWEQQISGTNQSLLGVSFADNLMEPLLALLEQFFTQPMAALTSLRSLVE